MESWEIHLDSFDNLVLLASREEVETGNIRPALESLRNLLEPETAKKVKGRLVFGINGYDDEERDLWQFLEVRTWMRKLDAEFPYWFYFMDTGPASTLMFIAFALCPFEKLSGGSLIPPEAFAEFLRSRFIAMNRLAEVLGETDAEQDGRSREISDFFFQKRQSKPAEDCS